MKKRLRSHHAAGAVGLVLLIALLGACAAGEKSTEAETAAPPVTQSAAPAEAETTSRQTPAPTEPETSAAPTSAAPVSYDWTVGSYKLAEGTAEENEVIVYTSVNPGPVIYIVGGIHGDELAGWHAANRLKDQLRPICGTVYILSPANRSGAAAETRTVTGSGDLNRAFPGDSESEDAALRIAASIFADVARVQPDFVLDLHEARVELGGGSTHKGLANTLIYTDDSKISDLLFEFLLKNSAGELCSGSFALTVPGVAGSFNRVVTDSLGIPVVTTETWRKNELEDRIADQTAIIRFCLEYYGVIAPQE